LELILKTNENESDRVLQSIVAMLKKKFLQKIKNASIIVETGFAKVLFAGDLDHFGFCCTHIPK